MTGAINTVLELDRLGVLVPGPRAWFGTDSPVWRLLVAIFGWAAVQERSRLIEERTRPGLSRAARARWRSSRLHAFRVITARRRTCRTLAPA